MPLWVESSGERVRSLRLTMKWLSYGNVQQHTSLASACTVEHRSRVCSCEFSPLHRAVMSPQHVVLGDIATSEMGVA